MKKIGIALLFLCGIGILFFGRWHWSRQIASTVAGTINAETTQTNEAQKSTEETTTSFMSYAKNLPDDAVEKLERAAENNESVNLTLVAREEPSWVAAFEEELVSTYGEDVWSIETITYDSMTSFELLESDLMQQVKDTNPNVILYEAPLLNDNGLWPSEDSISFNSQILEQWTTAISDVTIMVQPSNPIHQGVNYPLEVEAFQAFIEGEGYIYIDYWETWPDRNSDEMLNYLVDGTRTQLNEAGYQLWADYLIDLFISR